MASQESPTPAAAAARGAAARSARSAWRLLAALALLNVLSYVDRQMVAALAPLLMADLGLSRAEIGLLVGAAFIVVYAAATLVMGLVADRLSRPHLLTGGLVAWSAATALTGTATGMASLALWRGAVALGEAALPPTALSMLADRFRPARLGLANGIYYAGIPVGFACSFALAGWAVPRIGWRSCFLLLGVAGCLGGALAARIADPPRAAARSHRPAAPWTALRLLVLERPAVAALALAGSLLAYTSASSQHGITWLVQERGFAYTRAAWLSALVIATAGLAGSFAIGAVTDRARRRGAAFRLLAFCGIGAVALAATLAFYLLPSTSALFVPCWLVAQAWLLGWYGPLMAAVLETSPSETRASAAGATLLVVNLLGVALGPWITGAIGDRASLTHGLVASVGVGALGLLLIGAVAARQLGARADGPRAVLPGTDALA